MSAPAPRRPMAEFIADMMAIQLELMADAVEHEQADITIGPARRWARLWNRYRRQQQEAQS